MNSIAVFAPLIINSFRELNENEEHIIEDITNDLKI
jgi:NADPH-dependent 7-cyano-7-deazaguanine reductase QueF